MLRTLAAETVEKIGQEVNLFGWVQTRRDHGKVVFIDLRDRSGLVQIVVRELSAEVHDEDVISVLGKVVARSKETVNPDLSTGKVEVVAEKVEILSRSKTPPFNILDEGYNLDEAKRLEYRYLDLRRPRLQANLRLRHKIIRRIREEFTNRGFVEVETPYLSKATPEGARDFLVPSRLQPGEFYALPQSPQQYKQLLMVAGFERYFQIVRCFRDEDLRADRQFEFTQVDVEISFPTQEEILNFTEEILTKITEEVGGKKVWQKPFPRFTHEEVMKKFGADKFDLRKEKDPHVLAFAWITDFPLFEKTEDRQIGPSHHPFTAPKDEDLPLLDSDPMKVHSWQHDLVCNGFEVGGGSIRITDPEIQKKVFKILGHSEKEIGEKFGHLLRAFEYGVPPHGGIALGLDRLLALWCGEKTIREVIAFPLTASGQTAVMKAPSKVSEAQLKELGIAVAKREKRRLTK